MRDELEKVGIAHGVRRFGGDVGTHSRLDAREADGVRAHAELMLQVRGCAASCASISKRQS